MKTALYNKEGKEVGQIDVPEAVFGLPWNADLVHQVVTSMQGNARQPLAHAKDRSEKRGGGRKPWKQKGTGRARHGSIRSPIWVGGGVTHGPNKDKDFSKKINKKMRDRALRVALSEKMRDGEVIFLDDLVLTEPKTGDASKILESLKGAGFEKINYKNGNRALITIPARDENVEKSFRNIGSALVDEARNINALELMSYKYVVIVDPEKSLAALEARIK